LMLLCVVCVLFCFFFLFFFGFLFLVCFLLLFRRLRQYNTPPPLCRTFSSSVPLHSTHPAASPLTPPHTPQRDSWFFGQIRTPPRPTAQPLPPRQPPQPHHPRPRPPASRHPLYPPAPHRRLCPPPPPPRPRTCPDHPTPPIGRPPPPHSPRTPIPPHLSSVCSLLGSCLITQRAGFITHPERASPPPPYDGRFHFRISPSAV